MGTWRRRHDEPLGDPRADGAAGATSVAQRWLGDRTWNELNTAWRTSSRMLTEAEPEDGDRMLVLAILRAGILDEMERHDPRAFTVWLAEHTAHDRRPDPGKGPVEPQQ